MSNSKSREEPIPQHPLSEFRECHVIFIKGMSGSKEVGNLWIRRSKRRLKNVSLDALTHVTLWLVQLLACITGIKFYKFERYLVLWLANRCVNTVQLISATGYFWELCVERITHVHAYNTRKTKTQQFSLSKARANSGARMLKHSAIEMWSKIPSHIKLNRFWHFSQRNIKSARATWVLENC